MSKYRFGITFSHLWHQFRRGRFRAGAISLIIPTRLLVAAHGGAFLPCQILKGTLMQREQENKCKIGGGREKQVRASRTVGFFLSSGSLATAGRKTNQNQRAVLHRYLARSEQQRPSSNTSPTFGAAGRWDTSPTSSNTSSTFGRWGAPLSELLGGTVARDPS